MTSSPSSDRTFELYVRSLSPRRTRAQQETIIERLEQLDNEDVIDEFTVQIWGKEVDPSTAKRIDAGQFVLNRVGAFEEWAQENDFELGHCFKRREIRSGILDETHTVLTLPVMVLAEVCDGKVQCVAPCVDGENSYTVIDWLDALEGGRGWLSTANGDRNRTREHDRDHAASNESLLAGVAER